MPQVNTDIESFLNRRALDVTDALQHASIICTIFLRQIDRPLINPGPYCRRDPIRAAKSSAQAGPWFDSAGGAYLSNLRPFSRDGKGARSCGGGPIQPAAGRDR